MPLYDFVCPSEHPPYEVRCSIADKDTVLHRCPECGEPGRSVILTAPAVPTTIVLDYPGSKKFKAGYSHTHADKSGTKTQSGYGGMIVGGSVEKATSDAVWKNPLG